MAIIVFIFCAALLPTLIIGNAPILNILNEMAAKGEGIHGVLKPLINGTIAQNGPIITYKASFVPLQIEVAMKFTPEHFLYIREYNMYSYLNAIDNSGSEAYGIPTVYYFDVWKGYTVLATKLLVKNILTETQQKNKEPLDILIMFREFVQITKYIHSCGVRHNDIKLENIMFDGHKVFITDYSSATKLYEPSYAGTMVFKSRRGHGTETGCARDDWESFLYSICFFVGIDLGWYHIKDERTIYRLKLNTTNTMKRIMDHHYKSSLIEVKNVIVELAEELFGEDNKPTEKFPFYNNMDTKINKEIDRLKGREPYALFSWLTSDEKIIAMTELAKNLEPDMDNPRYKENFTYQLPNHFLLRDKYRVTIAVNERKIK